MREYIKEELAVGAEVDAGSVSELVAAARMDEPVASLRSMTKGSSWGRRFALARVIWIDAGVLLLLGAVVVPEIR